jgi:hypothetical protein
MAFVFAVGSLVLMVSGAVSGNPLLIGAGVASLCFCCVGVVGTMRTNEI